MSVLDTLKKEHLLVRRYLDNIEVALDLMHKGGEVPEQFFNLAVDFSRNFMDKYHHFKEEYVIFLKLAEKKVELEISKSVKTWLAKKGYNPEYGARPLGRLIQKEISDQLSDEILFGQLVKGGKVNITLKKDKPFFQYV
mgnify:CR=1 FL=1